MKTKKTYLKTFFAILILSLTPLLTGCDIECLFSPRGSCSGDEDKITWEELQNIRADLVDPAKTDAQKADLIRRLGMTTDLDLTDDEELRLREEVILTLLNKAEASSFYRRDGLSSRSSYSLDYALLEAIGEQLRDLYRRDIVQEARNDSRYQHLDEFRKYMNRLVENAENLTLLPTDTPETETPAPSHIQNLRELARRIRNDIRDIERNRSNNNNNNNGNNSNSRGNNSNGNGNSNGTSSSQSSENSDRPETSETSRPEDNTEE